MNRTKAFVINSISAALLQVITILVGLVLPRVILSGYGSAINGLVSSITQFVTYLSLVEAGLGGAAIYALYKPLSIQNYNKINTIISTAKKFYEQSSFIFLILLIIIAVTYPFIAKVDGIPSWQIMILVLALGCKGLLDLFIMGKYRVLLTADQKIFMVCFASVIALIVHTGVVVVLAMLKGNIVLAYSVAIIALMLKACILYFYVNTNYKYLQFDTDIDNFVIKERWDVLYLQILGSIQQGLPVVVITLCLTLPIVSVYSIYNMVIVGITGLLSIFSNGLFASFGDVIAKKEINTLQKTYNEFEFTYYIIITWITICTLVLIVPFVKVYTLGITDAEYEQQVFGLMIVLNSLFYNIKTPQGMLVLSAGLYRETRWRTTIQGLIAVIGCFLFVKTWGLVGVMFAMILSNIYRCVDLVFFIPKYVTKLSPFVSIYRIIRMLIVVFLSVSIVPMLNIDPNSFLQWSYFATVVSIVCGFFVLFLNYLCEPHLMKDVTFRVKSLIK